MYNLTAVLRLRDQSFSRGMRNANRLMSGARSGAGAFAKQLGLITSVAAGVGVAMSSLNKAMDFEAQMSTIKALTGATNEEMKQMQKLALDMGAKTKYSALEASKGIEELLKAGISPATVKAGGLEAALNLATAGSLDLAEASEIMSTSLNSFSKDGMKAADAANILAGTANASATDVHDLKYSLSAVAAVASGAGLSLRDTSAALGVLANKGLKGSDAGTSLKSLLLQLQPTTKKTAKLFSVLGLETDKAGNAFYDAKGNIKSMADIAQVLQDKFKDMTSGERQAAFKEAFGTDAIRAANILYEAGAKGVKAFNDEMSKVTALDVAKEKMNNAQGAIEQFKGALETLQISVLIPLLPVIKDAATKASDFVANLKPETIDRWGKNIKDAGQSLVNFAKFVHDNWKPIKEGFISIAAGIGAAKIAMIGLDIAMGANPIGLITIAVFACVAAWVYLARNWDTVKAKAYVVWGVLKSMLGPIGTLIEAAVKLALNWDNTWTRIKQGAASAVNGVIGKINALIRTINLIPGVNVPIIPKVEWGNTKAGSYVSGGSQSSTHVTRMSHASGLSNVPYDGYQATLHKGERVLTPEETKAYNRGSKGGGINITGNTFNVRKDSDIKQIAYELAKLIEREGGAFA